MLRPARCKWIVSLLLAAAWIGSCDSHTSKHTQQPCYSADDCPSKAYVCTGTCVLGSGTECTADEHCTSPGICQTSANAECDGGTCVYPVETCDDGVGCTVDSCDGTTGECIHAPDDLLCDEAEATTIGVCDPTSGCQYLDVEAPTVLSSTPSPGTTRVDPRGSVSVTFSEAMAAATMTSANVTLMVTPPVELFTNVTTYAGHVYALTRTPATWARADMLAARYGGHLVSVADLAENTFLSASYGVDVYGQSWLGYDAIDVTGSWTWTDGSTTPFTYWDAAPGTGDCATLGTSGGAWLRAACYASHQAIVEWEALDAEVTQPSPDTALVVPRRPLHRGCSYSLDVSTAVTDTSGNPIAAPYTATFATPFTRYAVVTSPSDGTLGTLEIEPTTGRPRHRGYVRASSSSPAPAAVLTHPSSAFVHAIDGSVVRTYSVDLYGRLTAVTGSVQLAAAPDSLVISPDGRHLYVSSPNGNTVTPIAVDASSGALSAGASTVLVAPARLAMPPSGRFLYAVLRGGSAIELLERDDSTGALTDLGVAANGLPFSNVAVHPSGRFLFAQTGSYDPDPNDGIPQSQSTLRPFQIDLATGALAAGTDQSWETSWQTALAIDATGTFLFAAYARNGTSQPAELTSFAISPDDGALTAIATLTTTPLAHVAFMTLDPQGNYLYVGSTPSDILAAYPVNLRTGKLATNAVPITTHAAPAGLTFIEGSAPVRHQPLALFAPQDGFVVTYPLEATDGSIQPAAPDGIATGAGSYAAALDPFGRYLFVTSRIDGLIYAYALGPQSSLSSLGSVATSASPNSLVVDPAGLAVYVAATGFIDTFAITAGGLQREGSALAVSGTPAYITMDASGRYVFVTNGAKIQTFTVSLMTNDLLVTPYAVTPAACVASPDADPTPLVLAADPVSPILFAVSRDGSLYAFDFATTLGRPVQKTCLASSISEPTGIAVSPKSNAVHIASWSVGKVSTMTFSAVMVILDSIGVSLWAPSPVTTGPVYTLAPDASDSYVYAIDNRVAGYVLSFGATPTGLAAINTRAASPSTAVAVSCSTE